MASKLLAVRLAVGLVGLAQICGCASSRTQAPTASPGMISGKSGQPVPLMAAQDIQKDRAKVTTDSGSIRTAEHNSGAADRLAVVKASASAIQDQTTERAEELPSPVVIEALRESMPIDLPTALRLAGANHLQIALASERIREAAARLDQANVLWIPSVNLGIGYNRHDGRIQDTRGDILDVSRQSLYAGGGPTLGSSPLSGGASGPARLFVDLSLSDIYFQPLIARQNMRATQFESAAAFNDNVLQVGLMHQELVRAKMQVDIAAEAIKNAEELARLTENFAKAGTGLEADAQRARGEREQRKREKSIATERVHVVSAELVRLLRLDPSVLLVAVESQPIPLDLFSQDVAVENLVGQGLTRRPELAQHQARVAETLEQIRQEQWRPWLPNLYVGYAGAGFGGGQGSDFSNFGGRSDFDALAVWQFRNLGMGNRALQRERDSLHRQAHLQYDWLRDQVIAQVSQAHYRSTYRREQIEHASRQVTTAADAVPLNFRGIRDGQLRPIEAQQAIAGLAAARSLYLASVIDYNQAQLELMRAVGEPPNEGQIISTPHIISENGLNPPLP